MSLRNLTSLQNLWVSHGGLRVLGFTSLSIALKLLILLMVSMVLQLPTAQAIEVTGIITKDCKVINGLVVGIESENISLLELSGQYRSISQNEIQTVLMYNMVENPISRVILSEDLQRKMLKVWLFNEAEPRFMGWAVKFVENLIVFYDSTGKNQVVDIDHISKLRPLSSKKANLELKSQSAALNLGDLSTSCQNLGGAGANPAPAGSIRPSRILANQIQIEEHFVGMEKGYLNLEGHRERTYLYPRPLMFDNQARLGIFYSPSMLQNPGTLPVYLRWGSGKPFRYQSMYQFGGGIVEWLPNLNPTFHFRTEVKSHLFHASLVAHVPSVAAGSNYFNQFKSTEYYDQVSNGYVSSPTRNSRVFEGTAYEPETEKAFVMHVYNYMGLMGFDYGNWSFSGGPFFPVVLYYAQHQWREVLSNNMGTTLRLMYTNRYSRFRVVGGTSNNASNTPKERNILTNYGQSDVLDYTTRELKWDVRSFDSRFDFVRVGIDYDFPEAISASLDGVLVRAKYSEESKLLRRRFYTYENNGIQFRFGKRFGEYVSSGMIFTNFDSYSVFDFTSNDSHKKRTVAFGGYFEFIF